MTLARAGVALVLLASACTEQLAPTAAVSTPPSPTPAPTPLVALAPPSCAPVRPAQFDGRLKELGYVGYLDCSGVARNRGAIALDSLDVWVDQIDASGAVVGSCRTSVTDRGSIQPGREASWSATCPVTAAQRSVRLRATDAAEHPLATATPQ